MNHPDWVKKAIFYQVFPDRFRNADPSNDPPGTVPWGSPPTRANFMGGDLEGITQSLDYIQDLGCNALYLNPIFQAGTNHRYDTSDYHRIDPALGDDKTFNRLLREAHAREMRVVLDGVFNHCGLAFAPFQDVLTNGESSRYRNWFDIYDFPVRTQPQPNYATCGHAHYLPRLNSRDPEVAEFIKGVAIHWLERGIDGWRLDVPYEIHPRFWQDFRTTIKKSFPDAYLVAEEWRDPTPFLQGDTFDGAMHYRLREIVFDYLFKNALTGEAFLRALSHLHSTLPQGTATGMLTLLGSHDTERVLTAANGNTQLVVQAFTALLTLPGAPMIYYGDENGMEGANDPDCRQGMAWDKNDWNKTTRTAITRLTHLRASKVELSEADIAPIFGNDRIAAYLRGRQNEPTLVLLNTSRVPRNITVPVPFPAGTLLKDALCGNLLTVTRNGLSFEPLPAGRGYVLTQHKG